MQIPFQEYDEYRQATRGNYYNDFSFLNGNCNFPNIDALHRNRMAKVRMMQYTGNYADLVSLIFRVGDGDATVPLSPIRIPIYKLATNKTVDLIFQSYPIIRTGDGQRDKAVNKIIENTGCINSIKECLAYAHMFGYAGLRVNKFGINAILPTYIDKIVNPHDNTLNSGYFIYEPLKDKDGKISYLRFEVHIKGWIFERVFSVSYSFPMYKLGNAVDYIYVNRTKRIIPSAGKWYKTNIEDDTLLHFIVYQGIEDKVYGQSDYITYEDEVIVNEQRLTVVNSILNGLKDPYLIVGASMVSPIKDRRGEFELKTVRDTTGNNKYIVVNDQQGSTFTPQTLQHEYKLDNNMQMLDYVEHLLYMTTEMSKPFLLGEFDGSTISTESLKSLIKPAIDKSSRLADCAYYQIRDAIYDLARLNGINDIVKEDITIKFNIGTSIDIKSAVDILQKATTGKQVLSDEYLLEMLFDIDADQALVMRNQIINEKQLNMELFNQDSKEDNNETERPTENNGNKDTGREF